MQYETKDLGVIMLRVSSVISFIILFLFFFTSCLPTQNLVEKNSGSIDIIKLKTKRGGQHLLVNCFDFETKKNIPATVITNGIFLNSLSFLVYPGTYSIEGIYPMKKSIKKTIQIKKGDSIVVNLYFKDLKEGIH